MKYLVPLLVLTLMVAGLSYYTLLTEPQIPTPSGSVTNSAVVQKEVLPPVDLNDRQEIIGSETIDALRARGDALECLITYIENPLEPEITGTIFTDGGNLRGDFVVPTPDLTGQMVTSVVVDTSTVYQWTDINGEVIGSKQPRTNDADTLARLIAPIGLNRDVQHNCLTWPNVDRTVFNPPSDILFTEANKTPEETGTLYEEGEF